MYETFVLTSSVYGVLQSGTKSGDSTQYFCAGVISDTGRKISQFLVAFDEKSVNILLQLRQTEEAKSGSVHAILSLVTYASSMRLMSSLLMSETKPGIPRRWRLSTSFQGEVDSKNSVARRREVALEILRDRSSSSGRRTQ